MLELVDLDVPVLERLAAGDVAGASALVGAPIPAELVAEASRLWGVFAERRAHVGEPGWTIQLLVEDGVVVGHGGFHEPPDADGVVEIGYTVVEAARGRGLAQQAVRLLLERARASGRVRVVRGCTAPDNAASHAVLARCGFVHVGEVEDPEDGLELVHEVRLS